ncbi:MAG: NAD(P)-dependent alcohol dehydrogenase [Bacteroidales bacterium]|nr:NAD(P)-dependent alcohol dehydrogenase [Bacteroidales bacterium]MCF8456365.1 NAD(P)-dependent alcohol dehydrogenase [Bacteroidales bacterium]
MKAAIIQQWGSPEVFKIADVPKPVPAEDQILIKVFVSSINPVDWKHRMGNHKYILGSPFPIVLGYDVCGEVVETGKLITKFKVGDIVFGDLDNKYGGALAEYALGHEKCFALKPANLAIPEAAATTLVSLTALQAMRDKAGLTSGKSILINGASGGVGHVAVQIAKILGARIIAIASGKNKNFMESLGSDVFVDYTSEDILQLSEKVDVFFDTIGNYSFLKTKKLLKPGGIYVTTLPRPIVLFHKLFQPFSNGKKVKTILRKQNSTDLELIASWIEEGKLKINIDKRFPLDEISDAHAYAEKGRTCGKNVVLIQDVR